MSPKNPNCFSYSEHTTMTRGLKPLLLEVLFFCLISIAFQFDCPATMEKVEGAAEDSCYSLLDLGGMEYPMASLYCQVSITTGE